MLKIFVCKWYPSLKVEVPAAFLLRVARYSIFSNSSIILPGLRVSIGVIHALTLAARSYALLDLYKATGSYSSRYSFRYLGQYRFSFRSMMHRADMWGAKLPVHHIISYL